MIYARQLYTEELAPRQVMPEQQAPPTAPLSKKAIIQRVNHGYDASIGKETTEIKAIDEETGEIIASRIVRKFNVTHSQLVSAENEVLEDTRATGYEITDEKGTI